MSVGEESEVTGSFPLDVGPEGTEGIGEGDVDATGRAGVPEPDPRSR